MRHNTQMQESPMKVAFSFVEFIIKFQPAPSSEGRNRVAATNDEVKQKNKNYPRSSQIAHMPYIREEEN